MFDEMLETIVILMFLSCYLKIHKKSTIGPNEVFDISLESLEHPLELL